MQQPKYNNRHLSSISVKLIPQSCPPPFVVLIPLGAMLIFTTCLAIAGLALGVLLRSPNEYSRYRPIIGYVIVGLIALVQPSQGLLQHLLFRRNGEKTILGYMHRMLGRAIIILGMVSDRLCFRFAGLVGSDNVPKCGVVVYSLLAAVFGLSHTGFVIWQSFKTGATDPVWTKERSSCDSQRSINDHYYTGFSNGSHSNNLRGQGFTNAHIPTSSHVANCYNHTSSRRASVYNRVTG